MLKIIIKGDEFYDEVTETFETIDDFEIELEHSLVSLSKWESEFEKPFLGVDPKTTDETLKYIWLMILTPNVPLDVLSRLSKENLDAINDYIESKQSATTFHEQNNRSGRSETITAELIYYWMVGFNIPFECENWHLNKLFSLIKICGIKQSKPKRMSQREIAEQNRSLNEQRKAQFRTKG